MGEAEVRFEQRVGGGTSSVRFPGQATLSCAVLRRVKDPADLSRIRAGKCNARILGTLLCRLQLKHTHLGSYRHAVHLLCLGCRCVTDDGILFGLVGGGDDDRQVYQSWCRILTRLHHRPPYRLGRVQQLDKSLDHTAVRLARLNDTHPLPFHDGSAGC